MYQFLIIAYLFTFQIHRPAFQNQGPLVADRKSELNQTSVPIQTGPELCPLHKTKHSLNRRKAFKTKPLQERRTFLKDNRICFKCCESDQHIRRNCKATVKCEDCGQNHHTALHLTTLNQGKYPGFAPSVVHGGEQTTESEAPALSVASKCTQICHQIFGGKSCAKTLLVNVHPTGHPEEGKHMYAVIDDQSNRSLAKRTSSLSS